jgi:hypothetical protein
MQRLGERLMVALEQLHYVRPVADDLDRATDFAQRPAAMATNFRRSQI